MSVKRSAYLPVAGAKLYLLIRGTDKANPILLWLHGGPGGAERPLFRYYNSDLEKHFVVAYWDQRGAGRSFDPKADPKQLTISRHLSDLDAVVNHLRQTLHRDKVILVGHSWGAALALLYAREHPEKVSAVIGVNPLISTCASQQAEYDFVVQEAKQQKDGSVLDKINKIGQPPWQRAHADQEMEKLSEKYGGVFHREPNRIWVALRAVITGLVTPRGVGRIIRGNNVTLKAMHQELLGLDLNLSVPAVDVPVVFFLGRYDRHVNSNIAVRYLANLKAPLKKVVWFENSAHNVPFEEPDLFDAMVVRELRSLDLGVNDALDSPIQTLPISQDQLKPVLRFLESTSARY